MAEADEVSRSFERQARQLESLERLADRFGSSLNGALSAGVSSGRELSGTLDRVGASLQANLGRSVGTSLASGLTTLLQGAAQSLFSTVGMMSFGGLMPFARGGVISGGAVQPFAAGGIVSTPTYFPLRGGLGLMGERGAEAIMPLARGADGRLGVRAGGAGAPTQVNVTIQATDLASFKRSEAQVSAALARAVARGRRAL
jgi:phage-related minor tail protein